MEVGGLAGVCQEETAGTSQPASQAAKRQTKAEITQRRQRFLLPLPPRFLWCNSTPGESPGEQTHRTSSRPVLHRRLPLPLLSAFSLLAVFLVSFNSWFRGPAMSSPGFSGFSSFTGMWGQLAERQRCWEVRGYRGSRGGGGGGLGGGDGEEDGVCHPGEIDWRDIWGGAWSGENKTGVPGVRGYGCCGGQTTFDDSRQADCGLKTRSTFTRSNSHTHTHTYGQPPSKCQIYCSLTELSVVLGGKFCSAAVVVLKKKKS